MRFNSLFANSFDAVLLTKPDGSILSVNPAACKLFGMKEEEIKAAGRDGLIILDEKVKSALNEREKNGKAIAELTFKRKDGSMFQGEVTSSLFTDSDGIIKSSMIIRDVTERRKVEEKLRLSEERYRSLFEQAGEYILVLELPHVGLPIIRDANSAALKVHGYSKEEMINQSIRLIDKQFTEEDTKDLIRKVSSGELVVFEVIHQRKDGTSFTVEVSAKAIKLGFETWILTIERDITERKKVEAALKESEEYYLKLSSAAFEGIIISRYGVILDLNNQFAEMFGYENSELIGKNTLELVAPESKKLVTENMKKNYEGLYEFSALKKDGSIINVEVRAKSIFYKGSMARVSAVHDITQRKINEEKIKVLSSLYELASDAIFVCDIEGNIVFFNEQTYKQLGYTKEEISSLRLFDYCSSEAAKLVKSRIESILEKGYAVFESEHLTKDHKKIPVEVSSRVIEANGNKLILNVARDISERKKAQEELIESQSKLRLLAENMRDVVWVLGLDGKFTYISPSVFQLRGYTQEEVMKQSLLEVLTEESQEIVDKTFRELKETGNVPTGYLELEQIRKDGTTVWTEINFTIVRDENGKPEHILGVSRDITERKKIEAKLRQSDLIFENSMDMICMAGFDGYLKVLNPAWSRTLGWSNEELLSKPWIEFVHPDDREATINAKTTLIKGQEIFQFANRYICKDGSVRWLSWNSFPDSKEKKIFAVTRDITERKEAENRLALVNEKLRVTGSLTRHDVRNKLTIIKSNLFLLRKRLSENPELSKFLNEIDNAADASNKLFEFSSTYEKIGAEARTKINLGEYFNQASTLLPDLQRIKLINKCQGLSVLADSLIRQLFYNLLDNSLKHGKKVTEIRLYFIESGEGAKVFYEDNGAGIPQINRVKLFTEGFTTGNGSGLGLLLIKKMVEAYGWSITEEGEPEKGVKFVISIPTVFLS